MELIPLIIINVIDMNVIRICITVNLNYEIQYV